MCVFKNHVFIYFLRPPPWSGTCPSEESHLYYDQVQTYCTYWTALFLKLNSIFWQNNLLDKLPFMYSIANTHVPSSFSNIWQKLKHAKLVTTSIIKLIFVFFLVIYSFFHFRVLKPVICFRYLFSPILLWHDGFRLWFPLLGHLNGVPSLAFLAAFPMPPPPPNPVKVCSCWLPNIGQRMKTESQFYS
jgi:hypothetical protein